MEILELLHISDLWTQTDSTLAKVIWAFYIGVVIASVIMWFNQKVIGKVVRTLLKKEIFSPETAISAEEGGFNGLFVRRALSNEYSALRRVVFCTNESSKLKKKDFLKAGFYIPEELKYKADVKYHGKNTSIVIIIAGAIAMFFIAVLCLEYIPKILDLI